ncbi:LON peptidase substrate-binding domain-containing protein [Rhodococcus chondri]|uniref:LON peptidase substrate-binding domain-containing protein n=1 Tax=Rhodococcus chondri TaxID=3065941 RepID=A0ABU7JUB1_9NOCA|nr:LON peptidase substrate-binding domain-containing protein [Rhodococcus sp. CC-R104]MEE2033608.1 LON peptidase substrate-binding domain-containing protein [Rhodococcus sp. CC-R104]
MPTLPMFPLGTALLPGSDLPLQVFEPRYQELVRDCMAAPDGPRFGVVLIARGHEVGGGEQRHDVGTVARIIVDNELGGGRHALECIAEERIRVIEWLPDDPYPRAEVEPWPDTGSEAVDLSPLTVHLGRLYGVLDRLTEGRAPSPPPMTELPEDAGARLFALARYVPMGDADRYAVLAAPGPVERLHVLIESISTAIDLAEWRLKDR